MNFWSRLLRRRGNEGVDLVIDLQTDEYKENYKLGAAGKGLKLEVAEEVLGLTLAANDWYGTADYKRAEGGAIPWPKYYPQYARLRALGEEIYRTGGIEAMQRVGAYVRARARSTVLLENMWDGIGEWLA